MMVTLVIMMTLLNDHDHADCGYGALFGCCLNQGQVGQTSDASPSGRNDDGDYVVGDGIVDDHVDSDHGGQVNQYV